MVDPLPQLETRDLGRRSVLHEEVERDAAVPCDPRRAVRQSTAFGHSCEHGGYMAKGRDSRGNIGLDSFVGDFALDVDVQQIGGSHFDVFAADMILMRI